MSRTLDYSPTAAKFVALYIRNIFTDLNIKDLYIYAFKRELTETKKKYSDPVERMFETEKYCDEKFFINGQVKKPDFFPNPIGGQQRYGELFEKKFLLSSYDKKWVAQKYIEKNLQDLFPHTVSCVKNVSSPCKKCWWCAEKYWAFKAFDGEPIGHVV